MKARLRSRTCYDLVVDDQVKATFAEGSSWEGMTVLVRADAPGKLIVSGLTGGAGALHRALGGPLEVGVVSASPDLIELINHAEAQR